MDQRAPVSLMATASTGLGLTAGIVEMGDNRHRVRSEVDESSTALVGMMACREVVGSYFCRLALSAFESDETRKFFAGARLPLVKIAIEVNRDSERSVGVPWDAVVDLRTMGRRDSGLRFLGETRRIRDVREHRAGVGPILSPGLD